MIKLRVRRLSSVHLRSLYLLLNTLLYIFCASLFDVHYSVKGVGAVQVSPVPEKGDDSGKSDDFAEFDQDDDVEVEETGEFEDLTSNQQDHYQLMNCIDHFNDGIIYRTVIKGFGDEGASTPSQHEETEGETEEVTGSHEDEFDPFTDEEEFEGYNKEKGSKTKIPGPDLKITRVPVHLRAGWQAFYLELITILGLLVYAANFFTGKSKNSKLATTWFKAHKPLLETNFSIVGDDGMSKEPQSGVLVKESESVYTLWCTGRQYCEGMLVELKLLKRHDLVSVMAQMIRPKSEIVRVTVYMDDEDMDSFVFGVFPKRTAPKVQKELQDLNYFCTDKKAGEKYGLPSSYVILTETSEVVTHVLNSQVCKAISSYEDLFESLHFSDQYVGPKKEEIEEESSAKPKKPKKVLMFQFRVPGMGRTRPQDMKATEPLMRMVLHCIDRIKLFKLGTQTRAKIEKKRREAEESFLKMSHSQRQEAAMARREEKYRADRERMMSEEDPEKQKRLEEAQLKRDMKKRAPRMKQVKVRM